MHQTPIASTPPAPTPPASPSQASTSQSTTRQASTSRARTTTPGPRRTQPRDPNRSRFQTDPAPPPDGPALSLGPLRAAAPDLGPAAKQEPVSSARCSLRDQGVLGLQLRHQGNAAEVRIQLRQGGSVVEASLRETARGVEIHLTGGPENQPLLSRVAEALASQRVDHDFELDEVSVDTQGDSTNPRRQAPGTAAEPEGPSPRCHRRVAGPPGPTPTLPTSTRTSMGTSYSR